MTKIIESIQKIVNQSTRASIIPAVVKSFNADNWTCVIEYKNLELDARTRAVINAEASGIFVEPVVGSAVLIGLIEDNINALFVVKWSEIVKYKLDAERIELNGDGFSIVKAETLQQVMDHNAQFIQVFKNILSGPPITEPGNGAPSALQIALNTALGTVQWGDHSNIQNETIKHG
jgi:hypothetical protein